MEIRVYTAVIRYIADKELGLEIQFDQFDNKPSFIERKPTL